MRYRTIALACAAALATVAPAGPTPMIFAPGVISGPANDGSPSFMPDGKTLFFARSGSSAGTIMESHLVDGHWTTPEIAPVSSPATMDVGPEVAPDQSFLVFASAGRRTKDDPKEHLYMVRDNHGTWGPVTPIRYDGDDANGSSSDNEPSVNHAGDTLYFSSDRTLPPVLPRRVAQAQEDLKRIETWDNGNTNVWYIPMPA